MNNRSKGEVWPDPITGETKKDIEEQRWFGPANQHPRQAKAHMETFANHQADMAIAKNLPDFKKQRVDAEPEWRFKKEHDMWAAHDKAMGGLEEQSLRYKLEKRYSNPAELTNGRKRDRSL